LGDGARRGLLVLLVVAVLFVSTGCPSVGRTAYHYFDWAGETFTENPVSMVPFTLGLVIFFIAGLPFDLFSWPITAIAYPDEDKRHDTEKYWSCAFAPSMFLGTSGGILLGGIFYPFGIPFTPSDKSWDDERPRDDQPLSEPPGGSSPPAKAPKDDSTRPASGPR
jgi:hypothetical protein